VILEVGSDVRSYCRRVLEEDCEGFIQDRSIRIEESSLLIES